MKTLWIENTGERLTRLIPDSAVVSRGNPFFVPEEDAPWCAVPAIGIVIDRLGMKIAAKFASRYYSKFIVVSHQRRADSATPLEWMRDGALVAGKPFETDAPTLSIRISDPNGVATADLDTAALREAFDAAIAHVSELVTLKSGDIIVLDPSLTAMPEPAAHILTHPQNLIINTNGEEALKVKFR